MPAKASTEALPELAEFLAPFAGQFLRSEGREHFSGGGFHWNRLQNPSQLPV